MFETTKLNEYRLTNGYDNYFKGEGIDIGCGPDVLNSQKVFKNIKAVRAYDRADGDAQLCSNVPDDAFDFVYSSHCLEHLDDPYLAMGNWIRICKPGGHVVVAVPHEVYYEKLIWPSKFNPEHKKSFRLEKFTPMPQSIFVPDMINSFKDKATGIACGLLLRMDYSKFWEDQTMGEGICQIEFIMVKK